MLQSLSHSRRSLACSRDQMQRQPAAQKGRPHLAAAHPVLCELQMQAAGAGLPHHTLAAAATAVKHRWWLTVAGLCSAAYQLCPHSAPPLSDRLSTPQISTLPHQEHLCQLQIRAGQLPQCVFLRSSKTFHSRCGLLSQPLIHCARRENVQPQHLVTVSLEFLPELNRRPLRLSQQQRPQLPLQRRPLLLQYGLRLQHHQWKRTAQLQHEALRRSPPRPPDPSHHPLRRSHLPLLAMIFS
mmetsp:Transcript_52622/g.119932  ORF Transcript_52622/g.119932 Transcript_52622/m.119932 type:complete len:240 (-) Transcript_52622:388-1107(-)